jgi:hypothetical protein
MTTRTTTFAATVAAFTAAVAVAVAAPNPATTAPHPARIAVLADSTATAAQIRAAERGAVSAVIRRVDALPQAQGEVAALAARGYDTIVAAGPLARAAVGEADSAGLAPATTFSGSRGDAAR